MPLGIELDDPIDLMLQILIGLCFALLILFVTETQGVTNFVTYSPPYMAVQAVEAIGVVASIFLSLLLIGIYRQQNQILDEQRTAEQKPDVYVSQLSPPEEGRGYVPVTMSNAGEGAARNIRVRLEPSVNELNGGEFEETIKTPTRVENQDSESVIAAGNYLMPNETEVEFEIGFTLEFNKEAGSERRGLSRHPSSFASLCERLCEYGNDRMRMQIYVEYEDSMGEIYGEDEPVSDILLPMKGATSIREALRLSVPYEDYEADEREFLTKWNQLNEDSAMHERPGYIAVKNPPEVRKEREDER